MPDNENTTTTNTTTATTPTSYDLITINNTAAPDVKKGALVIQKNPKYTKYECEDGGSIVDVIEQHMLKGSVSYNGLFQSEAQSLSAVLEVVSTLEIYNPMTGNTRRFLALITPHEMQKIIHDSGANAWTFGFDFEEIGDAPEEES